MAETSKESIIAELRRFLYLGDEFKPYPYSITFPFLSEKVDCIFKSSGFEDDIIREVSRVFRDGHYLGLEPIIYALAKLALSKELSTKHAAFKAASELCLTSTTLFLFVHIYKELSKPSKGWGHSHRRFLCNFYCVKEARELAAEVTKVKSFNKWTHKDILCMAHAKPEKIGNAAVLKYLVKGYETAERDFSSVAEAEPVLKYLRGIHEIGRTNSGEVAARLIELHDLCLEQIPSKLVKTKEVALCLIPRVPVRNLLTLIPLYCKLGLLKLNSPHYKALLERLNAEETLIDGSIDPLESFLGIRKWQLSNRIYPSTVVRQNTPAIDDALQNLHSASYKAVLRTQKKYLIAVDVRPSMAQSSCFLSKSVSPSNVSKIILLALVKAELSDVTVLVFSPEELVSVDINNKMTISDVEEHITKVVAGPVNLSAPLQWALTKKKSYDLFVVFSDLVANLDYLGCTFSLKEYKDTLHLPHTRYLLSTLCDSKSTAFDDPDMLNIVGFNIKLLKIIQDFACGRF